jgi:hypothetical protein
MTARNPDRLRLFTRGFWAMMALATLSFLAAAAVVAFGSRHLAVTPRSPAGAAPLAAEARGAKTAPPDPSLGPP